MAPTPSSGRCIGVIERGAATKQSPTGVGDCFAPLAMTASQRMSQQTGGIRHKSLEIIPRRRSPRNSIAPWYQFAPAIQGSNRASGRCKPRRDRLEGSATSRRRTGIVAGQSRCPQHPPAHISQALERVSWTDDPPDGCACSCVMPQAFCHLVRYETEPSTGVRTAELHAAAMGFAGGRQRFQRHQNICLRLVCAPFIRLSRERRRWRQPRAGPTQPFGVIPQFGNRVVSRIAGSFP